MPIRILGGFRIAFRARRGETQTEWRRRHDPRWFDRVNPSQDAVPRSHANSAPLSLVERRFRGAIAASLDAFFLCESVRDGGGSGPIIDFRVIELNARGATFLDRARDDILGKRITELLPILRPSGLLDRFIRVVDAGESFEDEVRVEDAKFGTRWVRHQAVPVGDGIAITSRDITNRRVVEDELRASEARYRDLVESVSDGMYRIDPQGIFTYANQVAWRVLGLPSAEPGLVGRSYLEFVRPDYHDQGRQLYRRQIMERVPVTYWEFPAVLPDGREIWIGQNVHIEERGGQVTSLFAVARNITERKQAEAALRESEERHRFLAENSTDLLSRHSPDGVILYASPASRPLLGYPPSDMVGHSIFDYCHADDIEGLRAASAQVLGRAGLATVSYRIRRRDGRFVWFETTSQAVRDAVPGPVREILSVSRDVTERRRVEEELRQAQKMEAVGQLAGGVAHDFNNLLTAIRGFTDLIAVTFVEDDPRRRDAAEVLRATERAAALTRQLLAFSRRQVLRPEPLSLNSIVGDLTKSMRRMLGDSIRVATSLDSGLWTVRADPGQMEQVLINLVRNARDAMPTGGVLTIETYNADEEELSGANIAAGRFGALRVTDTGEGMSDEVRAHIFEPFFTTRSPADRAGLGLSTVYGIVMQSGGHIGVRSAVGHGTSFTVYLPGVDAAVGRRTPQSGIVRANETGGSTILIAEDNEGVRALTVRVLENNGYRVLEAQDGVEALEVAAATKGPIDLLISDVLMPRMGGSELAIRFAATRPLTAVLFISGYMDQDAVRRASDDATAPVLQKPFTPEDLLAAVKDLIGAAARAVST